MFVPASTNTRNITGYLFSLFHIEETQESGRLPKTEVIRSQIVFPFSQSSFKFRVGGVKRSNYSDVWEGVQGGRKWGGKEKGKANWLPLSRVKLIKNERRNSGTHISVFQKKINVSIAVINDHDIYVVACFRLTQGSSTPSLTTCKVVDLFRISVSSLERYHCNTFDRSVTNSVTN